MVFAYGWESFYAEEREKRAEKFAMYPLVKKIYFQFKFANKKSALISTL